MSDAVDVKSLREKLKLTQAQLAGALGVDQGTVSNWETGKATPSGPATRLMARMVADDEPAEASAA